MELFKTITLWLALVAEAVAVLVISFAIVEAVLRMLQGALPGGVRDMRTHRSKEEVRLHLGRWLVLALEFLLAADIMRTAVAPTWEEIGKLAAIAVLRTALNFFLQKEIERVEALGRTASGQPA